MLLTLTSSVKGPITQHTSCERLVQSYMRVISLEQEAPLTLKNSAAVAEILKGNPKYMRASLTQGHTHFSSGCGFMVGLGKPKLCTKFGVPSFSDCVNIEVEPQNFGKLA